MLQFTGTEPIVGQPFTVESYTVTVCITCRCGKVQLLPLHLQAPCKGCGTVFAFLDFQQQDGKARFNIAHSAPQAAAEKPTNGETT